MPKRPRKPARRPVQRPGRGPKSRPIRSHDRRPPVKKGRRPFTSLKRYPDGAGRKTAAALFVFDFLILVGAAVLFALRPSCSSGGDGDSEDDSNAAPSQDNSNIGPGGNPSPGPSNPLCGTRKAFSSYGYSYGTYHHSRSSQVQARNQDTQLGSSSSSLSGSSYGLTSSSYSSSYGASSKKLLLASLIGISNYRYILDAPSSDSSLFNPLKLRDPSARSNPQQHPRVRNTDLELLQALLLQPDALTPKYPQCYQISPGSSANQARLRRPNWTPGYENRLRRFLNPAFARAENPCPTDPAPSTPFTNPWNPTLPPATPPTNPWNPTPAPSTPPVNPWNPSPEPGAGGTGTGGGSSIPIQNTDTTKIREDSWSNSNFKCGVQRIKPSTRIVGGSTAVRHSWPWIVALLDRSKIIPEYTFSHCGGTVVSPRHVISAYHCTWNRVSSTEYAFAVERHGINTEVGVPKQVAKIRIHPFAGKTKGDILYYDLALFTLKEELQFYDRLQPACLPPMDKAPASGKKCWAYGWGVHTNDFLKQVKVEIASEQECQSDYSSVPPRVLKNEYAVCAGKEKHQGTCAGDSGGPLTCNENGKWILYGATSYGTADCADGNPTVFAAVSFSMHWFCCFMGALPECRGVPCDAQSFVRPE